VINVRLECATGVTQPPEDLLELDLLQDWLAGADPSWQVKKVTVLNALTYPSGWVWCLLIQPTVVDGAGHWLEHQVLLVAPAVDVLTVLVDEDGDEYALLVAQSRPAAGTAVMSNPAGRLDARETAEAGARRELMEETNLLGTGVHWITLVNLNQKLTGSPEPVWASPGIINEQVTHFVAIGHLPRDQIKALQKSQAGLASEREFITVSVVNIQDVPMHLARVGLVDGKALQTWLMYREWRNQTV
jgi:8-oxo-dGTP pyrophosphatase MutT (NUDIX family)